MLRFTQVTKRFGAQTVIDALDLELPFEGISFVMGPSGAGKSVLAQVAVGLLRADEGDVTVGDIRITSLTERALRPVRRTLGYVAQGPALLDWLTLRENVALGASRIRSCAKHEANARADQALEQVGLAELATRTPPEVGPGTQKRAAVARALAGGARALVYDEPTTGLDPRSARQVDDVILAATRAGTAAIIVTHDLVSLERLGGRAVVLHRGRVGFDGPASALPTSSAPAVRALLEGDPNG